MKTFLTNRAKENQLAWAIDFADWGENDFADVIFSDEGAFNGGEQFGTIWVTREPGEQYIKDCLVRKFKKPTTIMVWRAIGGDQKSGVMIGETESWGKLPLKLTLIKS